MTGNEYLRREISIDRAQLDHDVVRVHSALVSNAVTTCEEIVQLVSRRGARRLAVAAYSAIRGEIDPTPCLERLPGTAYLPAVVGDAEPLAFRAWTGTTELVRDHFGVATPPADAPTAALAEFDLVLLPLVAFDPSCHRMGWGKGYYDRTLAPLRSRSGPSRPLLVGLAHEFQRVAHIEPQPWDVALDMVVTESAIHRRWVTP